jgi:hypothetical protein
LLLLALGLARDLGELGFLPCGQWPLVGYKIGLEEEIEKRAGLPLIAWQSRIDVGAGSSHHVKSKGLGEGPARRCISAAANRG